MDAATRQRIQAEYPAFAWLLNVPEVGDLLGRAATEGWDVTRLQSQLYATGWWRRTSQTGRNWGTLRATDPAEATRQHGQRYNEIYAERNRLGLQVTAAEMRWIAEVSLSQGLSQEEITRALVGVGRRRGISDTGTIRQATQEVRALAKSMAYPVGAGTVLDWAYRLAAGSLTMDGVQAQMTEWAKAKYAKNTQVKAGLERGLTMWDIMQPVIGRVSEELGVGEDTWDLTAGKGSKLVNYQDPATGELRLMNDAEATTWARSQKEWRKTNNGKALATQLADGITKKFGRR